MNRGLLPLLRTFLGVELSCLLKVLYRSIDHYAVSIIHPLARDLSTSEPAVHALELRFLFIDASSAINLLLRCPQRLICEIRHVDYPLNVL